MNDKRAFKRHLNEKHRWMESLSSSGGAFFHIMGFSLLSEMEFFAVPKNGISLNI